MLANNSYMYFIYEKEKSKLSVYKESKDGVKVFTRVLGRNNIMFMERVQV